MVEIFNKFTELAINYMQTSGIWFGFLIIVLESILPWLPLFVFIALNVKAYGVIIGFILSYIATITGCILSYSFFKWAAGKRIDKFINKRNSVKLDKVVKAIKKIDFSNLVLIMALPFTPAFLVNIACGITNVNFKKFFVALIISKVSIIYFWGFIGKSLIDSITDASTVMIVCLLLLVAFVISKLVVKKYDME